MCVRVDATDTVASLLGSAGVEEMLGEALGRLRNCVRTTDIVAGGEAGLFFILATDLQSEDEMEIISNRIQRTCLQPYRIHEQEIRSALTAGGAGGSDGQSDPATLTRHAVLAMRRAGSRGVAFEFFGKPAAAPAELDSGNSANAADDIFDLNFQPQFASDLTLSGIRVVPRIASSRAKTRVKSTVGRAAERKRNERVGDRMLRELLERAQAWTKAGLIVPAISIEIGANDLLNSDFADSLLKLLSETNTPGSAIDLLLTESTTLSSLAPAQRTLTVLAEAGVRFGLCGFSLNAGTRLDLRKLPFSSLRVSCNSLFKATSERESLWLARSIIGVAHRCGLAVVGEDVETEAQRAILWESGCDRFEGPLFSPAIGSIAMENLLRTGRSSLNR
jgi:EAL domain-containing protein (putative c-di-GMP-specific phosphodiesterase class I)